MPNDFSGSKKSQFTPFKQFKGPCRLDQKPGSYISGFDAPAEIAAIQIKSFWLSWEGGFNNRDSISPWQRVDK
jgi:hypothetical protein